MNKKNSLIKNTLILGLGKVSTQIVSLLLLPLYTSYLSNSDYGFIDLVVTYALLLAPIISLQLESAVFRFLIESRNLPERISQIITSSFMSVLNRSILSSAAVLFISLIYPIKMLPLIMLLVFTTIFSNLFLQIARGLGKNKQFAIASIISGLVTVIMNVLFIVYLKLGVPGIILSLIIANITRCIYILLSLKIYRYIKPVYKSKMVTADIIKYSLPLIPNGVSSWLMDVSDRTIISVMLGLAASGIYAIANKFSIIFNGFFYVFNLSWSESASLHEKGVGFAKYCSDVINSATTFFASLGLIMISFMPFMFPLLVGDNFNDAYNYIPFLLVGAFFNSVSGQYGSIYVAKKQSKSLMKTTVYSVVINLVINFALIKLIDIYAAAISTMVAYLAIAIFRHFDVKKYVDIRYKKSLLLKIVCSYSFAIIAYYINDFYVNILSAFFITVIVIYLNKSIIKVMKKKVLDLKSNRYKKLTA